MTSPQVDIAHIDCRATIGRLETELARVIRENEHLHERHKDLQARGTQLLEETRAQRREIAHLRHRDDHLTIAGGVLGVSDG